MRRVGVGAVGVVLALGGGATAAHAAGATFATDATTVAETNADATLNLAVTPSCGPLDIGTQTYAVTLTPGTATAADVVLPPSSATISFTCQILVGASPTTLEVPVTVRGDTLDEPDESFTVTLSTQADAPDVLSTTTVTITDEDPTPSVTIAAPAAATEGTAVAGTGLSFPVTLSAASGRQVTVAYATADGTATAGTDYTATSGTLTLAAGATSGTITVPVLADAVDEDDETVVVTLSAPVNAALGAAGTASAAGTIADDDTATVSVAGATVPEGAEGTQTAVNLVVSLSTPSAKPVSVSYKTIDGTATSAGGDYLAGSGTVTIGAGLKAGILPVTIVGDGTFEPDEIFGATISDPVGTTIADKGGTAPVIIKNDDAAPSTAPTVPGSVVSDPGAKASLPPVETTEGKAPIRVGKLRFARSTSKMRYDVVCPEGAGRCKGSVSVFTVPILKSKVKALRKEQKLGTKRFDLAAGQTATLTFALSASAKRWLKQAKSYRVIAYGVSTSTVFGVSTAKTTGTLKR